MTGVYLTLKQPIFFLGKSTLYPNTILPLSTAITFITFLLILSRKQVWQKLKLIPSETIIQSLLLFTFTTTIFASIHNPQNILWYFSGSILIYNLQYSKSSQLKKTFFTTTFILALISFTQIILQSDLNIHILGEPNISSTTKAIAKLKNNLIRPYGLSQHPNILAFILYLSLFLNPFQNTKYISSQLTAILTTFSLSGILATSYSYIKTKKNFLILSVLSIFIITILKSPSFILERITQYAYLLSQSIQLKPWELQPFHNTFILSLFKFGPIHLLSIVFLLFQIFHKQKKLAIGITIFMLFDHHILTNYQSYTNFITTISILYASNTKPKQT